MVRQLTVVCSLQGGQASLQLSSCQHLVAANTAGLITLFLTNPITVVKTRFVLSDPIWGRILVLSCSDPTLVVNFFLCLGYSDHLKIVFILFLPVTTAPHSLLGSLGHRSTSVVAVLLLLALPRVQSALCAGCVCNRRRSAGAAGRGRRSTTPAWWTLSSRSVATRARPGSTRDSCPVSAASCTEQFSSWRTRN